MKASQYIILTLFVIGAFYSFLGNFIPRKAREPYGPLGILIDLILYPLLFWLYLNAGAFSEIFK